MLERFDDDNVNDQSYLSPRDYFLILEIKRQYIGNHLFF